MASRKEQVNDPEGKAPCRAPGTYRFFVCFIAGSRVRVAFFVELGAAIIVATSSTSMTVIVDRAPSRSHTGTCLVPVVHLVLIDPFEGFPVLSEDGLVA